MKLFRWTTIALQKSLIVALIGFRPVLGPPASCNFYPTCTQYAYQQLCTQALLIAFRNVTYRLLQCHPWGHYISSPANWLSSLRSLCSRKTDPKIG